MSSSRATTSFVLFGSASAVAGLLLGAGYGLLSGALEGSGFTIWLTAIGALLGLIVGAAAFVAGAGVYAVALRMRFLPKSARIVAAFTSAIVSLVIVGLVAGPYLAAGYLVPVLVGLVAGILAWVLCPAALAKSGRVA